MSVDGLPAHFEGVWAAEGRGRRGPLTGSRLATQSARPGSGREQVGEAVLPLPLGMGPPPAIHGPQTHQAQAWRWGPRTQPSRERVLPHAGARAGALRGPPRLPGNPAVWRELLPLGQQSFPQNVPSFMSQFPFTWSRCPDHASCVFFFWILKKNTCFRRVSTGGDSAAVHGCDKSTSRGSSCVCRHCHRQGLQGPHHQKAPSSQKQEAPVKSVLQA